MKQLLPILLLTLTAILGRADEDKKPVELTPRIESEVGKIEMPTGELLTPAPVKELEGFFVPEVFSSDMVLQRNVSVPVWGLAATGTVVTVSFKEHEIESTARDGTWRVVFPPMPASSEPQEMTCLLYTSPSPRDRTRSRMPSSA